MNTSLKYNRMIQLPAFALAAVLLAILTLPILSLFLASTPADLLAGIQHRLVLQALYISAWTTTTSLALIVLMGTPLAWWLSTTPSKKKRFIEILVYLPIVMPPAVLGVGLLTAFGRLGLVGRFLDVLGIQLPFTPIAVIIAQICVSAPFFIQAAVNAFRRVDVDLMLVACTLGSTTTSAFFRIAIPIALPGLAAGAALAWARSIGEFGATLLFAGNLSGSTQTMPLAIYSALESDHRVAIAISLLLALISTVLLVAFHALPRILVRQRGCTD